VASQENPKIRVSIAPTIFGTYSEITDYVKEFEVEDGGVLKIPEAKILLRNPNGRFTDPGKTTYIDPYSAVKIEVSTRVDEFNVDVWDEIFRGWFYQREDAIRGIAEPECRLTCYGVLRRFLEDRITKAYKDENDKRSPDSQWHLDDVIEDMIQYPDGGASLDFVLKPDKGQRGLLETVLCKHNFKKGESLFNALRRLLEGVWDTTNAIYADYDGWVVSNDVTLNHEIWLYDLVNNPQLANPMVTLQKSAQVYGFRPFLSLNEIGNYILVYGDKDPGQPVDMDR